ncbi:YbaB/EbfC family nucleoid-associated protein [Nonomuraea sp. NPDC059194]|uniref:YbaB/EbfC family nucleoid-associated protein n=1 Tax=Nonomuraea sp. NPDC059194 TaxID=3346764 RepID=UPI0036A61412
MEEMADAQARLDELITAGERAETLVEEWTTRHFTGTADDGRIIATTDALGSLLTLDISPVTRRRLDTVQLADAILAAIVTAEQAAEQAKDELMNGLRLTP